MEEVVIVSLADVAKLVFITPSVGLGGGKAVCFELAQSDT